MKTYLFDSLARFKRFSESLDIAAILSNKTWVVFNDSGERELYIFKTDGNVYITTNGIGYQGTWEWLSANKSLIIHKADTVFMLHPEIVEECVLVLTLDGTKDCVFLIEDQNRQSFAPKTLAQLQNHFEEKERKALEDERQRQWRLEQKKMSAFMKAGRARIAEEKAQKQREEQYLLFKAQNIIKRFENPWLVLPIVEGLIFVFIIGLIFYWMPLNPSIILTVILVTGYVLLFIYTLKVGGKDVKKRIEKYKAEHPNDPANKYLSKYLDL